MYESLKILQRRSAFGAVLQRQRPSRWMTAKVSPSSDVLVSSISLTAKPGIETLSPRQSLSVLDRRQARKETDDYTVSLTVAFNETNDCFVTLC